MNLLELKEAVETAIAMAEEYGKDPSKFQVSIQVEVTPVDAYRSSDIDLFYDIGSTGCTFYGYWDEVGVAP